MDSQTIAWETTGTGLRVTIGMPSTIREGRQMDFLGEIVREPDPPGIDNRRWIDLIREHPNLVPPEPREGINPFTKKSMVLRPRPDVARVIVDGQEVGSMNWAEDGSNAL